MKPVVERVLGEECRNFAEHFRYSVQMTDRPGVRDKVLCPRTKLETDMYPPSERMKASQTDPKDPIVI